MFVQCWQNTFNKTCLMITNTIKAAYNPNNFNSNQYMYIRGCIIKGPFHYIHPPPPTPLPPLLKRFSEGAFKAISQGEAPSAFFDLAKISEGVGKEWLFF